MIKTAKIFKSPSLKTWSLIINFLIPPMLLITVLAVFVPFSPSMPSSGIDPSWIFAINHAISQGLEFGKDIIFTFGPYGSIYTKTYHPATDFIMLFGSLYLAISYWIGLLLLINDVQWRWILVFCIIILALLHQPDPLFFSYPLLVGLVSFKILSTENKSAYQKKMELVYMTLLFSAFGLLPLIKGTMLIMSTATIILCFAFFITNKKSGLAIVSIILPLISTILFWKISGQSIAHLPDYFISMAPIISGFTESMAVKNNGIEVILFLIAVGVLLLSITKQTLIRGNSKIFLFCLFLIFLFLSFKGGFVRHDNAHVFIAGAAILIAALLLRFFCKSKLVACSMGLAVISWGYINIDRLPTFPQFITTNIKLNYSSAWNGIINRTIDNNWPQHDFDKAVESLKKESTFPKLEGTTDIYSFNQSYLLASGNTWSPRPIIQSYSAYTPELADKNRRHLLGSSAPDNIIFKVEPIDERIPSIEDGASWPILISNYKPIKIINNYLFLRKKGAPQEVVPLLTYKSEKHSFEEKVKVPQTIHPIFVNIDIRPTIWGQIANIFFKPSRLQITVELKNGDIKKYRIVAGMAKSGFLISPLIENTFEFSFLYNKNTHLDRKQVKSFSIAPLKGKSMQWNNEYIVTFYPAKNSTSLNN